MSASLAVALGFTVPGHSAEVSDTVAANTESPSSPPATTSSDVALYTVVDKTHVDDNTLAGWKTWRAQACARCHGAEQEGLVGPSLLEGLKRLSKEEFEHTVKEGRIEKGMPPFGSIPRVIENLDNLYAYLKGRSDGAIGPGRLEPIAK
ncbi:hypothetical protein EKL30_11970 [Candidimonas sp. SYP-B2681]|nr:hypothetical protein EKL30_11970 [Candidimonas sp. SYP-B2681]